jgi:hypothetical protein
MSSSWVALGCASIGLLIVRSGDVSGLLGGVPKGELGRPLPLAGRLGADSAGVLEVFEINLAGMLGFAARFIGGGVGLALTSLLGNRTKSLSFVNDEVRSSAWKEAFIRLSIPDVAILRGTTPRPFTGDPFAGSGV